MEASVRENRETERCQPNRYLMQNMDWLEEELGGFEDDYLIIDCPGLSPQFAARAQLKERTLRAD